MNKGVVKGIVFAIACEFIYGCSYMFTKQATEDATMFSLLGWRFLVATIAALICVALGLMKINLKGKKLLPLFTIGLLSPVMYYMGETLGITYTTASESGAFLACIPIVSIVASTVILKKKPSKRQVLGIMVTFVGVVVTVVAVGVSASFSPVGYLMLILAVVIYSLYSVLVEKETSYTGTEITFFMIVMGFVFYGSGAIIEAALNDSFSVLVSLPFNDMGFLSAILYQGIACSILAVFMSNVAIVLIGVNKVSSFFGISTVVSILTGIIFLHESFTPLQVVGAAVIVAGVYIANITEKETASGGHAHRK